MMKTDSTMMKPRCSSLLRSCRVFWASCSWFRFWFNWSVWFWRDEMRMAADVSTCCMKPASSTSRQRRSSPNSFLTTHFSTSDSFWLDRVTSSFWMQVLNLLRVSHRSAPQGSQRDRHWCLSVVFLHEVFNLPALWRTVLQLRWMINMMIVNVAVQRKMMLKLFTLSFWPFKPQHHLTKQRFVYGFSSRDRGTNCWKSNPFD